MTGKSLDELLQLTLQEIRCAPIEEDESQNNKARPGKKTGQVNNLPGYWLAFIKFGPPAGDSASKVFKGTALPFFIIITSNYYAT